MKINKIYTFTIIGGSMKKKLFMTICVVALAYSITGCGENTTVSVNVKNSGELNNVVFGRKALRKIGDGLWYDSTTKIVYWWNEYLGTGYWDTTHIDTAPSPYYAPNGLPYRYNPETNTFEEITLK